MSAAYRSSISKAAIERVVERHPDGSRKHVECLVNKDLVGKREYGEAGVLEWEIPFRGGKMHGRHYRWDADGEMGSVEPYKDGVAHGVAKQWHQGRLLGTYRMVNGTGLDLWWGACSADEDIVLTEARYLRDGCRHGFEWWIEFDQRSVYEERHCRAGALHGIERVWNSAGRLCRGYPKYWVDGVQVRKRRYLTASRKDQSLPAFKDEDNVPLRTFPADVAQALRPQSGNGAVEKPDQRG